MRTATGSALISIGRDARDLHRLGAGRRAALADAARAAAGSPPSTGCSPPRPASASSATSRKGRLDGRSVEIQRLIGRSLRGVVDFEALGERTVYIDCDVLQADGGTRCASITGGMVALRLACARLIGEGSARALAADRDRRGGLLRDRRRRAAARPRLLRGLDRRGRRERRDDRRRRARRGAGDGRAHAAVARAPRRPAGARRGRDRRAAGGPGRRRSPQRRAEWRDAALAGARDPQRAQAARVRPAAGAGADRRRAAARRRRAAARGRRDVRRATRCPRRAPRPRRPGGPSIADDSGIEAAALGGAPRGALGALRRASTRPTRRTSRS